MVVSALLERLVPHILREVNLITNSKQEAETLSSKLERIQEGLQDAERQSVTEKAVRSWLKELEDVMYQMFDALDKWEAMKLELQIEQADEEDVSAACEKVRSVFLSLCLCFERVVGRREITLEMKALSARLDKILEQKARYRLVSPRRENPQEFRQVESDSSVTASKIYGRDADKDWLVKMLLSDREENSTRVISVFGGGGVGKTTLAQLAYDDDEVKKHFELKAWVSVPYPFKTLGTAKAILEGVGDSSSDASRLERLKERIIAFVSNKRFLLVLDNVCTEDHQLWEPLENFLVGAPGCRILVTTRSEITANMMVTSTTQKRYLGLLSDTECGEILNRIALNGRNEKEQENLREIGLKIAKKCNGLPLAARIIGTMLMSRFTERLWQDVLESPLWKYKKEIEYLLNILNLSYIDLSPELRPCFLSCALCPKGSQLHADKLIRIWMAQDYISSSATGDEVQSEGVHYFELLSKKSFFQELEREEHDEDNLSCKIHELMHEFANDLSKSEYYFIMDGRTDRNSLPNQGAKYMPLDSSGRIRYFCVRFVSQKYLPLNLFRILKCVRVLCLSDCDLELLPQEIGKLIHLRYLDLSGNPIKQLPETMCNLYNLQTLDLERCPFLAMLPHGMQKLIKLRHLLNSGTDNLIQFPQALQKLTGLWTLHRFRATRHTVGYLGGLNELRGYLKIEFESLSDATEAEKANLRNKDHIKKLELLFSEDVSVDVIEAILPPPQLRGLDIAGKGNQRLPRWITTSLDSLKKLKISSFDDCHLPPLGKLPMLEKLDIGNMKFKSVMLEFLGIRNVLGGFPKLQTLAFESCELWEEWEDVKEAADSLAAMPCLQELRITSCPKLKALPHNLLRLATSPPKLFILESEYLESRYNK